MARFLVLGAAIGSQLLGLTGAIPYPEYILAPSDRDLVTCICVQRQRHGR